MKVCNLRIKDSFWINIIIIVLLVALLTMVVNRKPEAVFNAYANTPIYKGDVSEPLIAFACSVADGAEYIPPMLKILKDNDIKVTFFVTGRWAKQHPDLLMQMVSEGHEIGNHGFNHDMPTQLSLEQNKKEILDTESTIADITGLKTTLFSPPYGDYVRQVLRLAESLGYRTIIYSIDTMDLQSDGYQAIVERVLNKAGNGDIISMHPTRDTLVALPIMIRELKSRGLNIGCVGDVISG
ncbi:polysaccharide deacetylase family protein [Mahella sp.]|uniref:polysaccharide deacetylase family protein n=1 Tax=Mahella sp. TaxID=2798721 RepID=UPI0025C29335|nr:polysaccharide deacetylase family protein [Mahella sp.]MBZ4664995.1 polysaccharide deacetylase [Mahella sp.]